jgi:hypothetical protein
MRTANQATDKRSGPGLRSSLLGLGAVGVLLAIAIGTPAALVVVSGRTCACAQPPDLVVQNADARPATVEWRHEGGSLVQGETDAGTVVVAACDSMSTILPQGRVHVVVSSASEVRAFDLDIPQRFATDPFAWRVVREGGAIEDAGPSGPDGTPFSTCDSGPATIE